VASLTKFLDRVRLLVADLSPAALLKRALITAPAKSPEAFNLALALVKDENLAPMNCIESLLLAEQTDRLNMARTPTEFIAFFLKSRSKPRLKIFTYTVNQAGIGGLKEVVGYVEREMAANSDWELWMNLHNHNFFLDKPDISGVPSPSGPDVGAFRSLATDLGLREARVTNGFHTLRIESSDFFVYQTR